MDTCYKINRPVIIAMILLACISSIIFYNLGYSKANSVKPRAVYIKTTEGNVNLTSALHDAGIQYDAVQIESVIKSMRGKHAR